ncbi:MAG TPA: ATP synthase subunit I [Terracidiphilus sp.]|nr:ATP synthase subunit I [Terracidiphilus sp.]
MTEETKPGAELTDAALEAMLRRAVRNTLILGVIPAVVVLFVSGWRDAAMLASGAAISTASILEWRRLVRFINARLDNQKTPKAGASAAVFFVLRLSIFAGVIYVSLRCFHGSVLALFYGLSLAVATLGWEALRLLRE